MLLPQRNLTPARTARAARRAGHRIGLHLAGAVALATAATLVPATAQAAPWPGHSDRSIVRHTVKPGETATGLAVRYHAWTAELFRLNHLGPDGALYQGQVLKIPVVVSAWRKAHGQPVPRPRQAHPQNKVQTKAKHHQKHAMPLLVHRLTPVSRKWLHADLSRDEVRHLVSRMARRYHVPRTLALAIAWQESGWQQRRISSAGAIGVMQVMPDTGRWMRWYAGRPLRLRDTHDNVQTGMLTLRTLRSWTRYDNNAIAAYYQGLGAVRKHGYFRDTHAYVRSVRAHQRQIIRTGSPI
ncbi:MAG: transglycosylase SLT domain-containing protein [Marmoricola sp.]